MAYFNYSGGRLYYELDGQLGLPNLILSNSLGTNLSMWDAQIAVLRERFTLLRYDGRGHGRSSVPAGPYTLTQLGKDVLALSDHINMEHFSFCGLSMGGLVGQWLGINASDRLHKLMLCNTSAKIGADLSWNQRIETVRAAGMGPIVPAALERWFTPEFRAVYPASVALAHEMLLATDAEGYVANCTTIRDADFRAEISHIKARTLIVYGKHDPVTTPEDAQFLASRISNAATLALDAAHLSNIEAAHAFSAGMLDFLSEGDSNG